MSFTATNPSKFGYAQVKLNTAGAMAITGGEAMPVPDPSDRPGWHFEKTLPNEKINVFVGVPNNMTVDYSKVQCFWSIISIDDFTDSSSLPWLSLYTATQGDSGDHSWYRSKVDYTIPHDRDAILPGERVCIWHGKTHPPAEMLNGARTIQLVPSLVGPNPLPTDRVQFLVLQTDSAATACVLTAETVAYQLQNTSPDGLLFNLHLVA